MKKVLLWGSAILCCAMTIVGISCSDEDSSKEFGVDDSYVKNGVEIPQTGAMISIPVSGSSDWTASLPEDCEWAGLLVSKGKGGQKVVVLIDAQPEDIARSTNLTVTSGKEVITIPMIQKVGRRNAGDSQLAADKSLGRGLILDSAKVSKVIPGFTTTTSGVFNMIGIDSLAVQDKMHFGQVFSATKRAILRAEDAICDSIEKKKDSLCVKLTANISYGTFKLDIKGRIRAGEQRNTTGKIIRFAADYPVFEASVNYDDLVFAYRDWIDEGCPETTANGQPDYRSAVLSVGFANKIKRFDELIQNNPNQSYKTNATIKRQCKAIIDAYSPLIITRIVLGGNYMLEADMDSIYTKEYFNIDSAKVSTTIQAGLFKLEAGVSVDYEKAMEEWLEHSVVDALVVGGNKTDYTALYGMLTSRDFTDKTPLTTWANGLKLGSATEEGNLELLTIDVVPIWVFLSDEAQEVLVEYIGDQDVFKKNEYLAPYLAY